MLCLFSTGKTARHPFQITIRDTPLWGSCSWSRAIWYWKKGKKIIESQHLAAFEPVTSKSWDLCSTTLLQSLPTLTQKIAATVCRKKLGKIFRRISFNVAALYCAYESENRSFLCQQTSNNFFLIWNQKSTFNFFHWELEFRCRLLRNLKLCFSEKKGKRTPFGI